LILGKTSNEAGKISRTRTLATARRTSVESAGKEGAMLARARGFGDQARGCPPGLAVGDAIGAHREFIAKWADDPAAAEGNG
jgi:hypothetical protein